MSDAEIDDEIRQDQASHRAEGTAVITPENDLLRRPPYVRRRNFLGSLLFAMEFIYEELQGDYSDDCDEFDDFVAGSESESDYDSDSDSEDEDDVDPATLPPAMRR
mmetsp:Transcript_26927/g.67549  ORF Transcript_26927/g.67549 Transcript_26927/m.67549 type:complete len:106 (+) Transcript_26927:1505-1822(+)